MEVFKIDFSLNLMLPLVVLTHVTTRSSESTNFSIWICWTQTPTFLTLRLHLFWCKTNSRNHFTLLCLFGYTWKIWSNRKSFLLTVIYPPHTRKSFYTFILPTNHFQKISLLTHSHHSRQAQAKEQRELSLVKPRSSPQPTAPPVWSRRENPSPIWSRRENPSPIWLRRLKPISDEPDLIVLAFASTLRSRLCLRYVISPLDQTQSLPPCNLAFRLNPIASTTWSHLRLCCAITPLDRTQSPLSLPSSLNLTDFDELVLLGFVSLVFIYWEIILYICLENEKMWENGSNK